MLPTGHSALQDERFLLLCLLGRGGMASVYRAFDRIEQRVVALKVLCEPAIQGETHPMATEYEAWATLRHPNIVRAFELAVARRGPLPGGAPYLVLEHVDGPPLDRGLPRGGLSPEALERVGRHLLRGLQHIDSRGLVHRDIKPSNVLIARDGARPCYKLTDFGLAVARGESDEPGRVSGSLPYVAPESLLGRRVDTRTDLYGLGILLFQLATGRLPVTTARIEDLLRWHLAGPPADPRRIRPRFPPRLARFIRRLTARDPTERPRDPAEALAWLGETTLAARTADSAVEPLDPSTRASLRLALDSVRHGASCRFRLPHGSSALRFGEPLRAWAHLFGLGFHDLRERRDDAEPALLRVVLRLLLEAGGEAGALVGRFGLDRCLPLRAVGGVPLADLGDLERSPRAGAAAGIADFLLDRAGGRGLVLLADSSGATGPLTREVVAALGRRLARPRPPRARRRGMLLVLASDPPPLRGSEREARETTGSERLGG